ncbi:DDB1- and CUL4-associated factor 5-like isoform X1 [Clavelina lepadiformis]|uniref:DDB1-and CUL4-associated factor 5 n=1 Tax=Clavelina lepadiformis TaxID=159417 RepID=A0ABP0FF72_CLALP
MLLHNRSAAWNLCKRKELREINGNCASASDIKTSRFNWVQNLYCSDWIGHFACVNAVEFSNGTKEFLASGGDDKRVLLWNLGERFFAPNYKPTIMVGNHISNIFCLAFDMYNKKLFSSGNDEQILVHDLATSKVVKVYIRDDAVYSLSTHPYNDNIFATACEDGRLHITDMRIRTHTGTMCLANYISAFHGVAFNPLEPLFVAGAHSVEGAGLWDVRKPKKVFLQYGKPRNEESTMSVRFNELGSRLFVLRRRRSPRVYKTHVETPVVEFSDEGYLNSCTMKSGCFAGENDEYVVSGSDNFKIYLWKIPDQSITDYNLNVTSAKMVLKGHRSIVNQVRYNKETQLLASSGVEKSVKTWSPFKYPGATGQIRNVSEEACRPLYSSHEYIELVVQSGMPLSQDYENENTNEDPRMMAFFDSLLQHDMNHLSDSSSDEENGVSRLVPTILAASRSPSYHERQEVATSASSSGNENGGDESDVIFAISSLLRHRLMSRDTRNAERSQEERDRLSRLQALRESIQQDTERELSEALKSSTEVETSNNASAPSTSGLTSQIKQSREDSGISCDVDNYKEHSASRGSPNRASTSKKKFHEKSYQADIEKQKNLKRCLQDFSDEEDSGCNELHSQMRRRNASRRKKCIKWVLNEKNTKYADNTNTSDSTVKKDMIQDGATKMSQASCSHQMTLNESITTQLRDAEDIDHSDEMFTTYELSAIKLNRSIVKTDLRLAKVASEMKEAIDTFKSTESNSNEATSTLNFQNHISTLNERGNILDLDPTAVVLSSEAKLNDVANNDDAKT